MFNGRLFLGRPLAPQMILGALTGMAGVCALFWPEFTHLSLEDNAVRGLLLGIGATAVASLGNIIATRNASFGLPVISANAWGMLYGTAALVGVALVTGAPFGWSPKPSYLLSLVYLAVFGSVVAFGAYLRLLATIGPDRAGYSSMLIPVVALLISTLVEGYRWTLPALVGHGVDRGRPEGGAHDMNAWWQQQIKGAGTSRYTPEAMAALEADACARARRQEKLQLDAANRNMAERGLRGSQVMNTGKRDIAAKTWSDPERPSQPVARQD